MTERVLLVGMMGAGKTTVGRELARRLGWPYVDSDAMVEEHTGKTVPELFEERGEAAFRAEESRALAEAVTSDGPVVVSVAGGAVLDPDNRKRLADGGTVVWLRAEVATLAARVGDGRGRPLLTPDPETALRLLYQQRRSVYEEVADVVVDVDHRSAGEVAEAILAEIR